MDVLAILLDVVKQPALIVGIFSFIGLMALRKPFHKVLTGTLWPVLGYIMMMAGAKYHCGKPGTIGRYDP